MTFARRLLNELKKIRTDNRGNLVMFATVYGFIAFSVVVMAVSGYAIAENRASVYKHTSEMAFQVAEAGANYYKWHLAHNPTDYQDGTASSGPYIHDYEDKDGAVIGHFSLDITPPPTGSSIVVVESTGWLDIQPNTRRTIRTRLGFPSLTDYSILTEADIWIGDSEVVHGKFHSNHGIRFDGIGDAPITSAVATYTCHDHDGCGYAQIKDGIWGFGGPQEFWDFPVPAKDFDAITLSLSKIEAGADNGGGIYLSSSGYYGWRLKFLADGNVETQKVTEVKCYKGKDIGSNKYYTYCVDIKTLDGTVDTYPLPTSSYIYVEDNVWVEGIVNGRASVGTCEDASIIFSSSTVYLAKDGNHVLGLVAEQNVLVPHDSPERMEIDAAMIAQNGAAKRYYYPGDMKTELIVYGSIITNGQWTWSWVSGGAEVISGYRSTTMIYDENLTYGPPAGFPVGTEYRVLSWEIVR
jgi:hypothetical protein